MHAQRCERYISTHQSQDQGRTYFSLEKQLSVPLRQIFSFFFKSCKHFDYLGAKCVKKINEWMYFYDNETSFQQRNLNLWGVLLNCAFCLVQKIFILRILWLFIIKKGNKELVKCHKQPLPHIMGASLWLWSSLISQILDRSLTHFTLKETTGFDYPPGSLRCHPPLPGAGCPRRSGSSGRSPGGRWACGRTARTRRATARSREHRSAGGQDQLFHFI